MQCPSYEAGRANGIHHSCLDFPGLVGVEVVHSRSLRKSAGSNDTRAFGIGMDYQRAISSPASDRFERIVRRPS